MLTCTAQLRLIDSEVDLLSYPIWPLLLERAGLFCIKLGLEDRKEADTWFTLYNWALWVKPPFSGEASSYLQISSKLLVCLLLFQASLVTVKDFCHCCKTKPPNCYLKICFLLSGTHLWGQQFLQESERPSSPVSSPPAHQSRTYDCLW